LVRGVRVQSSRWLHANLFVLVGTRDLRTLWSPPVSLNQERDTQRRKAVFILFYFIYLFIYKFNLLFLKSPPWKHTRTVEIRESGSAGLGPVGLLWWTRAPSRTDVVGTRDLRTVGNPPISLNQEKHT
jgi:hypothetical protein